MKMNSRRIGHVAKFHMIRIGDLAAVPQFHRIILCLSCGCATIKRRYAARAGGPNKAPDTSAVAITTMEREMSRGLRKRIRCRVIAEQILTARPSPCHVVPDSEIIHSFDASSPRADSNPAPLHSHSFNTHPDFHTAQFLYGTHLRSVENFRSHSVS